MATSAPTLYKIGQFVGYVPIEETIDLTPAPDATISSCTRSPAAR